MSRNPKAQNRLQHPLFFSGKDSRYQTPKELKEFMVPHLSHPTPKHFEGERERKEERGRGRER